MSNALSDIAWAKGARATRATVALELFPQIRDDARMLQLIAEGPEPRQRWRQALASDRDYRLGRSAEIELPVPWEPALSRVHCLIKAQGGEVAVEVSSQAQNPVYHRGEPIRSLSWRGRFVRHRADPVCRRACRYR